MSDSSEAALIHDWNRVAEMPAWPKHVAISDETLRDGLQSPSVRQPEIQEKVYILYLMDELGIETADLGLPGAGERFAQDVTVLAREIAQQGLGVQPQAAARTVEADIQPIVDASQAAGIPIEVALFVGSSPIRQYAEGWDLDRLLHMTEAAVTFAVRHGLPVMFVTEDTTRATPDTLRKLYGAAIRSGARSVCVADTVGHATPEGVSMLVSFVKGVADEAGEGVAVDFHGHRDRGLDIPNSLAAVRAGATRIHACALGIGERSGNTPMEVLLVNLALLGIGDRDLTVLPEYCQVVSEACDVPIPFNYPVVGMDAFRTSTGVHAAAIVKASARHDAWLAERVYCGVPAGLVGRTQGIEIGPMSGEHNVRHWLKSRDIELDAVYVEKILAAAKRADRLLPEEELLRMIRVMRRRRGVEAPVEGGVPAFNFAWER
ncbi:2-isopropylmalate synthase [bacterium]|nr:2-isopropylmalate synthase [Chloroflexi bacterium CFX6]RIL12455.1 MAG: 2-isopropylmalate synthase [bacterium]